MKFDYQNQSLETILEDVEQRYQVFFTYANLNLSKKVNVKYNGRLRAALYELLAPHNIAFKLIGDNIVLKFSPPILQNIKGQILDADTQIPLIGANVFVLNSDPLIGASADEFGNFILQDIPLGRYDIEVQYIGYETVLIPQLLLIAGKENVLNIQMKEAVTSMPEIVVTAKLNRKFNEPLNEMASVSAQSFSVDDAQRFAAAISDPARMVQSFAGVSNGGDDLSNEINIRGNNSRGLLWRLEGIDIPSPNHFADYVSGGGAISMLSSNMLANSDFYTGAFPAEYGNALSGVFDLHLRNGNADQREHSIAISTLGLEASTEGYFSKKAKASYLINYRYSILRTLDNFLLDTEDSSPSYQDVSFKINIPTSNAGKFSIFGIGGKNEQVAKASRDSLDWKNGEDLELDEEIFQKLGLLGFNHLFNFSKKTFIKSAFLASAYDYQDLLAKVYHQNIFAPTTIDKTKYDTYEYRTNISVNHKFNAQHQIRGGVALKYERFQFDFKTWIGEISLSDIQPGFDTLLFIFHDNRGDAFFFQSFLQWKNRFHPKWNLNTGFHFSYLFLNNTFTIDPRITLTWDFKLNQSIQIAAGIHSKPEHTSTYFIQPRAFDNDNPFPNLDLKMPRAFHWVGGYEYFLQKNLRFKIEGYYQYLFDIPVSNSFSSGFSVANSTNIFSFIFGNELGTESLVSEGEVFNYGLDFTLEKRMSEGYYFLITSSLFDSKYTTRDGRKFHARNATNFLLNVLAGREWKISVDGNSRFGMNAKYTFYGGNRVTPIDLEASIAEEREILMANSYYSKRLAPYIRFDFGVNYILNRKGITHTLRLDFQNLSNRRNIFGEFYNRKKQTIQDEYQNGLIPFITYKIDFVL